MHWERLQYLLFDNQYRITVWLVTCLCLWDCRAGPPVGVCHSLVRVGSNTAMHSSPNCDSVPTQRYKRLYRPAGSGPKDRCTVERKTGRLVRSQQCSSDRHGRSESHPGN
jgi:hypothetical protein